MWARLLLDSFASAGIRDVVISPGSRSTPFVLAAHLHPDLRCHDVFDERSAGFFALGQAKACGEPSLLLCTSGTAAAHYLPAVMEASLSHTPLVVLSADRPLELHGCGANQTVDQSATFGGHLRRFAHLGLPDPRERALRALRRVAVQAVASSRAPVPGPVHVNAPARKPLEPPAELEGARELEERYRRLVTAPITRVAEPRKMPEEAAVRRTVEAIAGARRGLIVCGPAPITGEKSAAAIRRLAAFARMPIAAEATSQVRFAAAADGRAPMLGFFDPLYRCPAGRERLRPDLVLQLGSSPASTGLLRLFQEMAVRGDVRRIVVSPYGWPDPESSAELVIRAEPGEFAGAVLEALEAWAGPMEAAEAWAARATDAEVWIESLARADALAREAVEGELSSAGDMLTEGGVARAVLAALPEGALLALGNSLPVRQVDAWCSPGPPPLRVLSQRGLSGIDGLVSGAAGAARRSGRPTALLVGDVSFLHDVNGLFAARGLEVPLVVVVVNNDGGRIFEELPLAAAPELAGALPHFTTPHGACLEHASALYGHPYLLAESVSVLGRELTRAFTEPGCTVIEASVPPQGAAEQNQRVRRVVEAALADAEPLPEAESDGRGSANSGR
jgi:2-succinyl-5-enolpyruvyl-6-hydroxy-3-cyclohexene-1-carboxylate synthase